MENVRVEERKLRFLLVVPLIVLPFATAIFWVLGGGEEKKSTEQQKMSGLNTELPGAKLDDKPMNKMSYYDAAKKDSALREEMRKDDPFFAGMQSDSGNGGFGVYPERGGQYGYRGNEGGTIAYGGYEDPHETRVQERLQALSKALEEPTPEEQNETKLSQRPVEQGLNPADIDRLEKMMNMMQGEGSEQDPELQQLNGMLENILDIQHPERIKEKLRQTSSERKGQVFSVAADREKDPVSMLVTTAKPVVSNGFFSENEEATPEETNSIKAVVHETQTLVVGSVVKLRLLTDIYVNGVLIPKDHFIFGTASLEGERLGIDIDNIRYGSSLYPVKLTVHDLDGLIGIHVPGAITRDVAKQSSASALQGLSMTTLDPSLGAQAAAAGIEFSKSLMGRKVKQVKVTVKAGYRVLLKDDNRKEEQ